EIRGYVVHVAVGELQHEPPVRLQRIVDLDLRNRAFAPERAAGAVLLHDCDNEVVNAHEPTGNGRASRRRHRYLDAADLNLAAAAATTAASAEAARHPQVLQRTGVDHARSNPAEIAARRVAAAADLFEISLSRRC